jgi:taurine--2-oxoglutarate transaminase
MFDLPDEDIIPLAKEHVFWTWSAQAKVDPIAIKKAEGVYFWDIYGKKYLDLNSMTMCVNVGHGDKRIIQAMCNQVQQLAYAAPGMATNVRSFASKKVAEISPEGALTKILFTLGGADANENAIKIARAYTGKFKILTRYRSYHGATAGAMAATGDTRRWMWEPLLMPGVVHFLDPYRYRSTFHKFNPDISEEEFTRSLITRDLTRSLEY